MNKTVLSIGIIFLLIGVSIVSSTGNIVEDEHTNYQSIDSIDVSKKVLSRGQIAYAYIAYSPIYQEGPCYFDLDNPEDIEELAPTESAYFLSGGTWSYDYGWFGVEYNSGILWTIDHETGEMQCIGGGGTGMGDLAWDECTSTLYGTMGSAFYEIDPEDGEQIAIGGSGGISMLGIAFDSYCICYGVGYDGYTYNLYTIDFSSLEITFVATLTNFSCYYSCNIEFDKDIDVLYILTGSGLYTCDTETGECTLVGNTGGTQLTALAIPFWDDTDTLPPVTTYSLDPPMPDGENGWYISDVNITLNATDDWSGVKTIYYKIPDDEWKNHSGDSIRILLDHDCLMDPIEFYSVDYAENQEEIKSADIDIDQLPPPKWLSFEVIGGNPLKGWIIEITAYVTDNCSGASGDRVEFYLNGGLQAIVTGPGPNYTWCFTYFGDLDIDVGVYCCDIAGNCAYYEIPIKSSRNIFEFLMHPLFFRLLERFPLLKKLLLS